MKYELIHDSIARLVFDKASTEARTRRKVERYIRELFQAYHERGSAITQDDLDYVTPYLSQVNISAEEADFVEAGRKALIQQRRNRRILVTAVVLVLALISSVALWQWRNAELEKERAEEAQSLAEQKEQEAKESEQVAIMQREIADSAKVEADNQRIIALEAKEEVQQKLDEVLRQKRRRVEALLSQFPRNIRDLAFEDAHQLVKEIIAIDSKPRETRLAVAELLFFYQKSGRLSEAFELAQRGRALFATRIASEADTAQTISRLLAEMANDRSFSIARQKYIPVLKTVRGTRFWMGSEPGERSSRKDETLHEVRLSDYQIGVSEVTVLQYYVFSQATDRPMPTEFKWKIKADQPMVNISWHDAVAYCNWLSKENGVAPAYGSGQNPSWDATSTAYRLPTEAEWMLAAHGGFSQPQEKKRNRYAGGEDMKALGWYKSNSSSQAQAVKQKQPNELGLYDMSGNVWEWCWDGYDETYFQQCKEQGLVINPKGPSEINEAAGRVNLGGGYGSSSANCRINNRSNNEAGLKSDDLGFRICRSI
ncbi:MAG: SUMF1/EgtB/PvdO family nonheme iron enzyme [Bacteroidota bacterium]